ncbi:MAG: GNAT family N-acetyltransferase [Flavobacteriaceae bacterium]
MSLDIVPFEPQYARPFAELNLAWLKEYFYVEPIDAKVLHNCEEVIIDKGGHIFFARLADKIVGCYAYIKKGDGIYEFSKMAVDPSCQGMKVGQKLMQHSVDFARKNNWEKTIIYSNTILGPAIHIYKKFGYVEVPVEPDVSYERSNIKMELVL